MHRYPSRPSRLVPAFLLSLLLAPRLAAAQGDPVPAAGSVRIPAPSRRAYGVGESLSYDVAVGGAKVGTGSMAILGRDSVRDHPTFHSRFTLRGGILFFKVDDDLESWFDTSTVTSYRFVQHINEGGYHARRFYEIYPSREVMQQRGSPEQASVAEPLDDASFLYFIRTVPLTVGKTYVFNRYFQADKNPVTVKVLRTERVTVPAGTFNTVVIQPIIHSGGIFADGGQARIWLTTDDRRMMVQFKSRVKFLHSLDLYLRSYRTMAPAAAQ